MCGRFSQLKLEPMRVPTQLALLEDSLFEMPVSYNLAPTQLASVVLDRGEGLQLERLSWGLLPFWAKARGFQGSTINARIETVATKPAFRSAFKSRRCLVPMAGYFEWTVNAVDKKKDPWFIHAEQPLWAAGLWEDHSPLLAEGNRGTFTLITGDSSGISADIHDRMPIPLAADHFADWLKADSDDAMALLLASSPPPMQAYRVSRRVNTPRNNDPSLLAFETGSETRVIEVRPHH